MTDDQRESDTPRHRVDPSDDTVLAAIIGRWIDANIDEANPCVYPHYHMADIMDAMTGGKSQPPDGLQLGIRPFRMLAAAMHARGMPRQPGLVISLDGEHAAPQMQPPADRNELIGRLHDIEEPWLVMRPWDADTCYRLEQRYTCPLPFALFEPPIEGVYAEYRESRWLKGREWGWSFHTAIYAYYIPDQYWSFARYQASLSRGRSGT